MTTAAPVARTLEPGIHRGISMRQYQALYAIGSHRLEWLAVSPLAYLYRLSQPEPETDATIRGTALHTAVLEPDLFDAHYAIEPDPEGVAPDNAKPRATKAYRDAVATLEAEGRIVLRGDAMEGVRAMTQAVHAHPHAARLLARAPEREVTAIWERDDRRCRGRIDILGPGVAGDLKTTRDLKGFSPWEISKLGYWLQASWYVDGLRRLGRQVDHWMFVAVESTPPHDVGVFVLDEATLQVGIRACDRLLALLGECEASGHFPGMFPNVVTAELPNALLEQLMTQEEES